MCPVASVFFTRQPTQLPVCSSANILCGLGEDAMQVLSVEPSLLISFRVETDRVLDLRDNTVADRLG
jgi:hypothetical protein